ncbi:MAG: RNA-guided pseudouridylation complex pseudouridine synthase subunit Cbf5 [Candidatus Pacearchaeota archaeon]|nr:RNA-guided pseudouridylation complex pseudouridine synthase subunit Cbf5 [Candidatus Pacearchaeota archaeon]
MEIEKLKSKKTIKELLEFGIMIFDKPADWTSFDVVNFVRSKLKLRKASHFGTLDPMVTGVLPLALNRAVKLTGFFIGEDKEYTGVMRIHEDVSLEEIRKVIKEKFVGKIIQMPPVRSSVKRQEREREIKKFELLEKDGKNISFRVECQGGTYVRKLVHDLGEEMKIGAHMTSLRRVRAGIFLEKDCVNKEQFEKAVEKYLAGDEKELRKKILPAEIITKVYPIVKVKGEFSDKLLHGAPLDEKFLTEKKKIEKKKIICVFNEDKFIGMYKVVNEGNIFAKAEFILQPI